MINLVMIESAVSYLIIHHQIFGFALLYTPYRSLTSRHAPDMAQDCGTRTTQHHLNKHVLESQAYICEDAHMNTWQGFECGFSSHYLANSK